MSPATLHTPPKLAFTRIPGLCADLDCSRSTALRRVAAGHLTRPVRIAPNCVAWPQHEIEAIKLAILRGATPDELQALVSELHAQRTAPQLGVAA